MLQKVFLLRVKPVTDPPRYRARPASVAAEVGDTVKFINFTDHPVVLNFNAGIFGTTTLTVAAGGEQASDVQSIEAGNYPYTGRVHDQWDVEGDSSPEIIIDRITGTPVATSSRP